MKRITDVEAYCEECDWRGTVGDCDSGPDGCLLCPECGCFARNEYDDIEEARGPVAARGIE